MSIFASLSQRIGKPKQVFSMKTRLKPFYLLGCYRLLTGIAETFKKKIALIESISIDVLQAGPNVPEMAGSMRHCSSSNQPFSS